MKMHLPSLPPPSPLSPRFPTPRGNAAGACQDGSGSAFVNDLASATPPVPVGTLHHPIPAVGDAFGCSVSVSGNRVVVSASVWNVAVQADGKILRTGLSRGTATFDVGTAVREAAARFPLTVRARSDYFVRTH